MGDFNAESRSLPVLHTFAQQGWDDLGAIEAQPTCFATRTSRPTRIDFALANWRAKTLINSFETIGDCTLPVHRPLRIGLKLQGALPYLEWQKPGDISLALHELAWRAAHAVWGLVGAAAGACRGSAWLAAQYFARF